MMMLTIDPQSQHLFIHRDLVLSLLQIVSTISTDEDTIKRTALMILFSLSGSVYFRQKLRPFLSHLATHLINDTSAIRLLALKVLINCFSTNSNKTLTHADGNYGNLTAIFYGIFDCIQDYDDIVQKNAVKLLSNLATEGTAEPS